MSYPVKVFSTRGSDVLAKAVCKALKTRLPKELWPESCQKLARSKVVRFSNENLQIQVENVRDHFVVVIHSQVPPVSERLIELFCLLDAIKGARPADVLLVFPYYLYARSDKKNQPRISTMGYRLAHILYHSFRIDRVLLLDPHDDHIKHYFDPVADEITSIYLFADYLERNVFNFRAKEESVLVFPDEGASKRYSDFARLLQETIYEGIEKRNNLEKITKKNKESYIRPIMLIQAEQEKENRNKVYVERIRQFLINDAKIPTEKIAVQTSKTKDLPALEVLSSKNCPIRYIITVNALREGWDCPFAYILVSVSNLGARISVEQTIGRIMRLPHAKEQKDAALNSAYIFASTRNFSQTSEMVIKGLQENGYEDIVPVKSGVSILKSEFRKKIKDNKITVPYINIREDPTLRKLDYIGDLIGEKPLLTSKDIEVDFQITDDSQIIKIDIGQDDRFIREATGKLGLIYHYKDFTKDDLLLWFQKKIQRSFVSMKEMSDFLENLISNLLKKYKLNQLSFHRYILKDVVEKRIDQIVDKITTDRFDELAKEKLIITKGESFMFPDIIELLNICPDDFNKHLYEKAGKMNNEELDLAYKIDGLSNIFWWFRNPEDSGFYLQGWLKNKFYPDFIIKTKKGNYFLVEYKGEHLMGSEETSYKEALGRKWQELSSGGYYFELIDKKNVDKIIDKISKL